MAKNTINLNDSLKKLEDIVKWFEAKKEVDIEVGLTKVKEGAKLIKESRERLGEIENEFEEIKKQVEE